MGQRIFKLIDYVFQSFLYLIFPFDEKCLSCGSYAEEYLCKRCQGLIRKVEGISYLSHQEMDLAFECYSCSYYSYAMKKVILAFKYRRDFFCLEYLSELMKEYIIDNNIDFDIITFVPSDKRSLRKRGFNQSELLAKKLSSKLNKRSAALLGKRKGSLEQKSLGREDRWNNIKDSFYVKETVIDKSNKILLVDDVLTTGATAYFCAKELISCGFFKVTVLTAAKSNV